MPADGPPTRCLHTGQRPAAEDSAMPTTSGHVHPLRTEVASEFEGLRALVERYMRKFRVPETFAEEVELEREFGSKAEYKGTARAAAA